MATDAAEDLNRIVAEAERRSKYRAKTEFPASIVRFAERVEDMMLSRDLPISARRFKHEFITYGVAKVGFRPYVQKIVPIVHTQEEFENLLVVLGYEFVDDEEVDLRVLVCGDRNWDNRAFMLRTLKQLPKGTVIIEGAAKGADTMAAEFADQLGFEVEEFPANWSEHHRAAGPIRNQQMLDEGVPDVVLAFHEDIRSSKGTLDMVKRAKKEGVPVKILSGTKKVDIAEWLEEVVEYDEEEG